MPMVTKFALLSLFSNTEDSSSLKGLSSFKTRCSPKGGFRRMSSISSVSSTASECSSCPNFINCGGDPNYKNKINENDENNNLQNGTRMTTMIKKLEW